MKKFNWKRFGLINVGVLLMTVGIYFFKIPNGFSTGGVSGLAIILGKLLTFTTPATIMLVINMLLLVAAYFFVGKDFCIKTIYASTLFSLATWLLEFVVPMDSPFTDEPLLELCFAIILTSIGSAILFNCSSSSGGTDIVAMMLKKYTRLNVGTALLFVDLSIACSTFFVFDIKTGLFSLLGLFAKSYLIDGVIERMAMCKYFTIVTVKPDDICEYIINELKRGVTKQEATGEYTQTKRYVLLTAVKRSDAIKLRNYIKITDPSSFMMITNTSEIIGKGFRGM